MNRYFLEVAYHGGRYAGSQVQLNALTVQYELEKALAAAVSNSPSMFSMERIGSTRGTGRFRIHPSWRALRSPELP